MNCEQGILGEPLFYLSLYLKTHRQTYYALLQDVRAHGRWEVWLDFFLTGVRDWSAPTKLVIYVS